MERLNYAMNQAARENVKRVHALREQTANEEEIEAAAKTAVENILAEASEPERILYNARVNELIEAGAKMPYTERLDLIELRLRGNYAFTEAELDAFPAVLTEDDPIFQGPPPGFSPLVSALHAGGYALAQLEGSNYTRGRKFSSYTVWDVRRGRSRAELLYDIDALAARIQKRWGDVENDEIRDEMLNWTDTVMRDVRDTTTDDELLDKLRFLYDMESKQLYRLVEARLGYRNIDPDGRAHWDDIHAKRDDWMSVGLAIDKMQDRRARRLNLSRYEDAAESEYDALDYVYDVGPSFSAWRGWVDTTLDDYRNGAERAWPVFKRF